MAFLAWPQMLSAQDADWGTFLRGSNPHGIASNEEATVFFLNAFGASLELSKERLQTAPNEFGRRLLRFTAHLATWHLTHDLLTALEQKSSLQSILADRQQQSEWLRPSQPDLPDVLALLGTIAQLHPMKPQPRSPHEALFMQFLHEHYPDWIGTSNGWLTLAQTHGAAGVRKRLREAWARSVRNDERRPRPDDPAPSIDRFLRQSFLPIATAYVRATLLQVHVRNEQQAWMEWQAIKQEIDKQKPLHRLCGRWQWLIHNHQDHSDHKTVMVYPPPSQYHRMDPMPDLIRIQGDTVYIRWKFPRGIVQEESLLLSEKDRLLSGTFVNNLGPHGNITGRRLTPCPDPHPEK